MSDIFHFFIQLWRRRSLFANLSRVVTEGSHGLGNRLERQDEGSGTDLKNLHESCSRWSARLRMAAEYNLLMSGMPEDS